MDTTVTLRTSGVNSFGRGASCLPTREYISREATFWDWVPLTVRMVASGSSLSWLIEPSHWRTTRSWKTLRTPSACSPHPCFLQDHPLKKRRRQVHLPALPHLLSPPQEASSVALAHCQGLVFVRDPLPALCPHTNCSRAKMSHPVSICAAGYRACPSLGVCWLERQPLAPHSWGLCASPMRYRTWTKDEGRGSGVSGGLGPQKSKIKSSRLSSQAQPFPTFNASPLLAARTVTSWDCKHLVCLEPSCPTPTHHHTHHHCGLLAPVSHFCSPPQAKSQGQVVWPFWE